MKVGGTSCVEENNGSGLGKSRDMISLVAVADGVRPCFLAARAIISQLIDRVYNAVRSRLGF